MQQQDDECKQKREAEDEHDSDSAEAEEDQHEAPALMSAWDENADGCVQSDLERLIAAAFDGDALPNKPPRSDLLVVTHQQYAHAAQSEAAMTSEENNHALPPRPTEPAAMDAVLLQLIDRSCGADPALTLSYLLSLSDPIAAEPLLEAKISDPDEAASTGSPPLSRSQRQESVELAMRFFAITCLLQPHAPEIVDTIRHHLASAEARAATATATPAATPAVAALRVWEIPPASVLLDCSLDLLQSYLEPLNSAYEHASNEQTGVAASVLSTLAPPPSSQPRSLHLALHYNSIRQESNKSEFILLHCPNLDVVKFTTDAQYRVDSVMQLARGDAADDEQRENEAAAGIVADASVTKHTRSDSEAQLSSAKMLDIALLLSKRYHLNPWDVYMQRTLALFERVRSVARLRTHIDAFKADHFLTNPVATYTSLTQSVWPRIRGDDLPRISLLIDLCLECFAAILQSYSSAASSFTSPAKKKSMVFIIFCC